jgi:hypothetical protein
MHLFWENKSLVANFCMYVDPAQESRRKARNAVGPVANGMTLWRRQVSLPHLLSLSLYIYIYIFHTRSRFSLHISPSFSSILALASLSISVRIKRLHQKQQLPSSVERREHLIQHTPKDTESIKTALLDPLEICLLCLITAVQCNVSQHGTLLEWPGARPAI